MEIAAVILDFDGLILDTETPIFEEWQAEFRARTQDLDLAEWQGTLGTVGFDPLARLAAATDAPFDAKELQRAVRQRYIRRCESQGLLPGVEALLRAARDAGLRTAVASSSSKGWVDGWLRHYGIAGRFDCLCARDHVARVKPAPDLFLLAAARLNVPPGACLVFEDSPNGVRSARAAGMRCVAVPNALTRGLSFPEPDLVVASLATMSLAEILNGLGPTLAEGRAVGP